MHNLRLSKSITIILTAITLVLLSSCHSRRHTVSPPAHGGYSHLSGDYISASGSTATQKLLAEANSWIGTPYRYAGNDRSGIDCSALTLNVFRDALAISLPRNSARQAEQCRKIDRDELIAGDLVFFSSGRSGSIGHVGIYVGDGRIIHASPSKGVVIAPLSQQWFVNHYRFAGRVDAYYAMVDLGKKAKKEKKGKKKKKPSDSQDAPVPTGPPAPTMTLEQFMAVSGRQAATTDSVPSVNSASVAPTVPAPTVPAPSAPAEMPDSVLTNYFD